MKPTTFLIILLAVILSVTIAASVGIAIELTQEIAELREINGSLRERVVELTVDNEWLRNKNEWEEME